MANILIADDDASIRIMISKMVEAMGHRVTESTDGLHAYTTLKENPGKFDLLVTDLVMPKMDGRQLVQKLRLDPTFKEVPVIVLSAFLANYQFDTFMKSMEPMKCISKPLKGDDLKIAIETLLPGNSDS